LKVGHVVEVIDDHVAFVDHAGGHRSDEDRIGVEIAVVGHGRSECGKPMEIAQDAVGAAGAGLRQRQKRRGGRSGGDASQTGHGHSPRSFFIVVLSALGLQLRVDSQAVNKFVADPLVWIVRIGEAGARVDHN
jgi:hypothetical protein